VRSKATTLKLRNVNALSDNAGIKGATTSSKTNVSPQNWCLLNVYDSNSKMPPLAMS
jgi:hypothetical protein